MAGPRRASTRRYVPRDWLDTYARKIARLESLLFEPLARSSRALDAWRAAMAAAAGLVTSLVGTDADASSDIAFNAAVAAVNAANVARTSAGAAAAAALDANRAAYEELLSAKCVSHALSRAYHRRDLEGSGDLLACAKIVVSGRVPDDCASVNELHQAVDLACADHCSTECRSTLPA